MIVPVAMGDHHRGDYERERNKPWRSVGQFASVGLAIQGAWNRSCMLVSLCVCVCVYVYVCVRLTVAFILAF